jgi:flagellar hook-associated protein 2
MGTVGISFGSATSGQGFDVATTVTSILASEQQIETPWKTQLTALQAQDTAISGIGSDLATLTTSLQALTDFNGVVAAKQGSSSNTNVLTLTGASQTAVAGSHTIVVSSLAQTSSNYSATIANASDVLSGSLTIQVGSGTASTITVGSNSNTLASLVTAINSAGAGVTATVISDASGSRLSLVSATGGAAGQLTITSALSDATTSTSLGFTSGQTGQNGSLTVDGIQLSTASNTVTNAIPGVTFQMLASAAGSPVQVQITNDNTAVETAVSSFVSAYNAVAKDITTQEGHSSSGNAEPLLGNTTLSQIQSQLSSALLGGAASGSISSISQLGISLNNDGTLTLDTNALDTALNSNYSDIKGFLQNANSFGANLASTLNGLGTQAPNGVVYLFQQQNAAEEAVLNASITNEDVRIASDKETLTTELNRANQILQSIPSQLNQVNEIYSAVTGYNTRTG